MHAGMPAPMSSQFSFSAGDGRLNSSLYGPSCQMREEAQGLFTTAGNHPVATYVPSLPRSLYSRTSTVRRCQAALKEPVCIDLLSTILLECNTPLRAHHPILCPWRG